MADLPTVPRTIGLLGGMSWVSTAHYYEGVNAGIADALGGDHCAPLVLWQTDFARITELQRAGDWQACGAILSVGAKALVAAGAQIVAICANTMHLVAAQVSAAAEPARLVSIVDAVSDECVRRGAITVGLLGTAYTMESTELFPLPLAAAGITVLVPDSDDRAAIQRHTFEELIHNVVTDEARRTFTAAAEAMVLRGADLIVLACTEHGMVLADGDVSVPVVDSTALHVRALIHAALTDG
jgi:aspartate racemase